MVIFSETDRLPKEKSDIWASSLKIHAKSTMFSQKYDVPWKGETSVSDLFRQKMELALKKAKR